MVEHVVRHLGRRPLLVPDRPVAMEQRLRPVLRALEKHRNVGLYGMGGIGKTTLANAVFNQLQQDHVQHCCYVEIGKMAAEPVARAMQIEGRQQQMLRDLCGLTANFHGVQQNTAELWDHLAETQKLLLLDDVWSEDQLSSLLVKFGSQSKVIVTSRNIGLLRCFLPGLSSTTPRYIQVELLPREDSQ